MGKTAHELMGAILQPKLPEDLVRPNMCTRGRTQPRKIGVAPIQRLTGEPYILQSAQAKEDIRDLERARHPDARQSVRRLPGDVAALELDGPGIRLQAARDQIECGTLSRAIGANDRC